MPAKSCQCPERRAPITSRRWEICSKPGDGSDDCFHCSGRNPGQCWREAARKAVEEEERHG
ncbi:hypothetical protein [Desulfovibrio piger]|uniref:hypothetical protein n=1 Tax=Desulfovibrio piger TaxID=901 RepID=UPI0026ED59CF|nr:hypothetical protein [Desulfovibrio piger]